MKIEEHPGSVTIQVDEQGTICLTTEESWELLEWLYTHRGKLFRFAHHLHFPEAEAEAPETVSLAPESDGKCEPQPRWKTCPCVTCQFVRSVLKDGDQEAQ